MRKILPICLFLHFHVTLNLHNYSLPSGPFCHYLVFYTVDVCSPAHCFENIKTLCCINCTLLWLHSSLELASLFALCCSIKTVLLANQISAFLMCSCEYWPVSLREVSLYHVAYEDFVSLKKIWTAIGTENDSKALAVNHSYIEVYSCQYD